MLSVSAVTAQNQKPTSSTKNVKVETISFSITPIAVSKILLTESNAIAGIFVMKNSRVKRALSFKVKTRNPKLA
jgi:ribosomal protein L19